MSDEKGILEVSPSLAKLFQSPQQYTDGKISYILPIYALLQEFGYNRNIKTPGEVICPDSIPEGMNDWKATDEPQ